MGVREKYARLPPLSPDIEARLRTLPELIARHPIRLAYLFGSSARSPKEAEDIDIAILPIRGFRFRPFCAGLSEWLGTDRLDVVDLREAPLWLQVKVIDTGVCIYARTPRDRTRWETLVRMQEREGPRYRPAPPPGRGRMGDEELKRRR
jgi:predicted nucleotidyltransferase